jgi:glycosyltransferase involved in cell wall biosynthesis
MRVLHVIPTIALEHGGPSHAVRLMARVVTKTGAEVHVAATSHGTSQGRTDPGRVWVYQEDGVTFRLFPQLAGSRWNFSASLTRWLFTRVADYDVLHVHAPFSYPTWPACAFARRMRVPYLYRTLGTLDPWSLRQKAWKKRPYYQLVEKRNLYGAHAVHVTSRPEREAIAALGVPRDKIALIPLGIDPASRLGPRPEAPPLRLLFIGRLHPKKGIPLLLEALSQLRATGIDAVLDVAGSGDEAYARVLAGEVQRLALGPAVRFVGFVTGEAKEQLLGSAHVFVLPAYDENFGISVAEAMAYGVPVVVSEAVGIAEDVNEARAGRICATGDAAALAGAVKELMDPEERAACGRRGVALVASTFSIGAMGSRLVEAYADALAAVTR